MAFFIVELKTETRATVIVEAKSKAYAAHKALFEVKPNQWHESPVEVDGVYDESEVDATI